MTINEKLSKLLELANKSAVARKSGISRASLVRYIHHGRKPSLSTVRNLSQSLGVDFAWLIDDRKKFPAVRIDEAEPATAA